MLARRFGIFCVSLFSGRLRWRCYDAASDEFFEPKGRVCGTAASARQCDFATTGRHNATCVDSGDVARFSAHLEGQRPYFAVLANGSAYANYGNPDYGVLTFDDTPHAFLAIFQVWAGFTPSLTVVQPLPHCGSTPPSQWCAPSL